MGKLGVIAEIYPQLQSIANRKDKLAMIEEKIGMDRGQYYWNRRKMADSNVLLSCCLLYTSFSAETTETFLPNALFSKTA